MKRKERIQILAGHTDEHIRAQCKKLTLFEPHDLRSLISEARASETDSGLDRAVVSALRHRNQSQMNDLLRRLGVDPSQPDSWQRGFLQLACRHYGVARLALHQHPRTNRNAATWTDAADMNLLLEVISLRATGKSELQAIKQIVSNSKTRKLFPYGEKNRVKSHYSAQNENQKREAALRRRLQHLKRSSSENSILNQLLGTGRNAQSALERVLNTLDFPASSPQRVEKIYPLLDSCLFFPIEK